LASKAKPTAIRMNPTVTNTAELLMLSFCSPSVAQRIRLVPKYPKSPPTASLSPFARAGPRLATKNPSRMTKQPIR
jgi:hypothetical protein